MALAKVQPIAENFRRRCANIDQDPLLRKSVAEAVSRVLIPY